jgi:hypothetical protein
MSGERAEASEALRARPAGFAGRVAPQEEEDET